jgi:hypothetical protein
MKMRSLITTTPASSIASEMKIKWETFCGWPVEAIVDHVVGVFAVGLKQRFDAFP